MQKYKKVANLNYCLYSEPKKGNKFFSNVPQRKIIISTSGSIDFIFVSAVLVYIYMLVRQLNTDRLLHI